MFTRLQKVNWNELGASEMPDLLLALAVGDKAARDESKVALYEKLAPLKLIEGFGSYLTLKQLSENRLPQEVVPFLIHLLQGAHDNWLQAFLLEFLHALAGYPWTVQYYFGTNEQGRPVYEWAREINQSVQSERQIYDAYTESSSKLIAELAQELLDLLSKNPPQ